MKIFYGVKDRNISWQDRFVSDLPALRTINKAVVEAKEPATKLDLMSLDRMCHAMNLIIEVLEKDH